MKCLAGSAIMVYFTVFFSIFLLFSRFIVPQKVFSEKPRCLKPSDVIPATQTVICIQQTHHMDPAVSAGKPCSFAKGHMTINLAQVSISHRINESLRRFHTSFRLITHLSSACHSDV